MKTICGTLGFFAVLALAAGACGGGDGGGAEGGAGSSSMAGNAASGGQATTAGSGGANAGTSSTAGSKSMAGSTSGGSSAGTSGAGTSGAGGGGSDAMCSPGDTIDAALAYPDPIQNCGFDGQGELMGVQGFYRSIKLPKPIGPGDKFSFSVDLGALGEGTM